MKVSVHNFGNFRLDGGSMFGAVPKKLWSRLLVPDNDNCIKLATNSLVVEMDDKLILIDVGLGTKWDEKYTKIYDIEPRNELPNPEAITDVILTHLHFDHAGGISYYDSGELKLTYPNAKIHLQKDNFDLALNPNVREKASYLKENVEILKKSDLNLLSGDTELYPGINLFQINGHTKGQQWVKVETEDEVFAFPSDLMPTSHHKQLAYHMGYDMCTETLLKEKQAFFEQAEKANWTIIFQHELR